MKKTKAGIISFLLACVLIVSEPAQALAYVNVENAGESRTLAVEAEQEPDSSDSSDIEDLYNEGVEYLTEEEWENLTYDERFDYYSLLAEENVIEEAYIDESVQSGEDLQAELPAVYNGNVKDEANGDWSLDTDKLKYVSPARNQQYFGNCWAFGFLGNAESYLLAKDKVSEGLNNKYDFAEKHLAYYLFNSYKVDDPLGNTAEDGIEASPMDGRQCVYGYGNNAISTCAFVKNWAGAANEKDYPYIEKQFPITEPDKNTNNIFKKDLYHLQQLRFIENSDPEEKKSQMKQAIMNYGSISISYKHDSKCLSKDKKSFFNPIKGNISHTVLCVGWNDNYPADKFTGAYKPEKNGAWLIKNSWGADYHDNGFFWMSYENATIASIMASEYEPADNYDNNYFYDGGVGYDDLGYRKSPYQVANIYQVKGSSYQVLKAASIYSESADYKVTLQIYKNPKNPSDPVSGTAMLDKPIECNIPNSGYYTLKLQPEDYILLKEGESFALVFESDSIDKYFYVDANTEVKRMKDKEITLSGKNHSYTEKNQSLMRRVDNKGAWYDLHEAGKCARINGFTSNMNWYCEDTTEASAAESKKDLTTIALNINDSFKLDVTKTQDVKLTFKSDNEAVATVNS
ncbi:MAG: hypothetical protein K5931_00660, partial [Lachnospiraceae bacterium]|nr:hypothetical protein [Lachnospiraceae bacterium]